MFQNIKISLTITHCNKKNPHLMWIFCYLQTYFISQIVLFQHCQNDGKTLYFQNLFSFQKDIINKTCTYIVCYQKHILIVVFCFYAAKKFFQSLITLFKTFHTHSFGACLFQKIDHVVKVQSFSFLQKCLVQFQQFLHL